jgi:YbbR domain-containing protein
MIVFIRRLLFRDFWLKLFSLILAVLTWTIVSLAITRDAGPTTVLTNNPLPERTYYNIPIKVVFAAQDVRSVRIDPTAIQITVRGEGKVLEALQSRDIRAEIDLTGIQGRAFRKRVDITLPEGIVKVQVVPADVEVILPQQP